MSILSFLKRQVSDKAGTPPGTMVYIGESRKYEPKLSLFHYNETAFNEISETITY